MLCVGLLTSLLLDGAMAFYGGCFVLLCAACALWVRVADALTAPVVVPIAFTFGLIPVSGEEGGLGAWFVELATTLAVNAGWLYGGTLAAGAIVLMRRGLYAARRRRDRRPSPRGA